MRRRRHPPARRAGSERGLQLEAVGQPQPGEPVDESVSGVVGVLDAEHGRYPTHVDVADQQVATSVQVVEVGVVVAGAVGHADLAQVAEPATDDVHLVANTLSALVLGDVAVARAVPVAVLVLGHSRPRLLSLDPEIDQRIRKSGRSIWCVWCPQSATPGPAPVAPEGLPALALARPADALQQARRLVARTADPASLSFAHQAIGIVLRDSGQLTGAVAALRAGVAASRTAHSPDRVADVTATLGTALVMAGRTRAGLEELDAAAHATTGGVRARVLLRKATVLVILGRHDDALIDMRRALAGLRASGDTLWEARALSNRSALHLVRGELNRAERDAVRAQELFTACDQDLEVFATVQNRGAIAFCRGDLPATLRLYDQAARGCVALGVSWPELAIDRCRAYQAAGLNREAVDVVEEAMSAPSLEPTHRAELLFAGATAALAGGDPDTALGRARQARRMFGRQERAWWEARADLVALQARHARGDGGRRLVELAGSLGERLVGCGSTRRRSRCSSPAGWRQPRRSHGLRTGTWSQRRTTGPGSRHWSGPRAGWHRRSTGSSTATPVASSWRAAAGSTPWTSTGPRSAARSCARSPPSMVVTSPRWRSARRLGAGTPDG